MKRLPKTLSLVFVLIIIFSLCACGAEPAPAESAAPAVSDAPAEPGGDTRMIVDANGREVEIPQTVESIVCIGVGALRYTCYMQGQELVVGVEDYELEGGMDRLYNFVSYDIFKALPPIGGNGEPWEEEIIKVDPQVIVMSSYAKCEADELQSKTGIPVVTVGGSDTILDSKAFETIRILGELFGKEARAEELTAYLRSAEAELAARTAGVSEADKPSAYICGVSFKGTRGFGGTEAHYGPLALINANNLADQTGQELAFDVDIEQVLLWDPDVIFVDFNGMELIRADYAANAELYNSLTAVKEGRVYSQISFRSYAANLDTALADAYYAASILYPDAFADIELEAKIAEIYETLLGANPYHDLKDAGYEFRAVTLGE